MYAQRLSQRGLAAHRYEPAATSLCLPSEELGCLGMSPTRLTLPTQLDATGRNSTPGPGAGRGARLPVAAPHTANDRGAASRDELSDLDLDWLAGSRMRQRLRRCSSFVLDNEGSRVKKKKNKSGTRTQAVEIHGAGPTGLDRPTMICVRKGTRHSETVNHDQAYSCLNGRPLVRHRRGRLDQAFAGWFRPRGRSRLLVRKVVPRRRNGAEHKGQPAHTSQSCQPRLRCSARISRGTQQPIERLV